MKIITCIIAFSLMLSGLSAQTKIETVSSESELILKTTTGNIYGTLTVPANVKTSPVVLIIASSGPTDRDCNSSAGMQTNAYKMLAEGLQKAFLKTIFQLCDLISEGLGKVNQQ